MIELLNPGMLSLFVDGGRFGYSDVGVPSSSALDRGALQAANMLTGQPEDAPSIEGIGERFSLRFDAEMTFAITGARVRATLNGREIGPIACFGKVPWQSFRAKAGEVLRIEQILEGFRYYVAFSGTPELRKIIGSFTTNLECGFGGYLGRRLRKGDRIGFTEIADIGNRVLDETLIPAMRPPHALRVVAGPEMGWFAGDGLQDVLGGAERVFTVSTNANRTGIRLEGQPLTFLKSAGKSIISEGISAGTIQVPGDGLPIIQLYERTIGGYARPAIVVRVDRDLLAHLKPGDPVSFREITIAEAERLWNEKMAWLTSIKRAVQSEAGGGGHGKVS